MPTLINRNISLPGPGVYPGTAEERLPTLSRTNQHFYPVLIPVNAILPGVMETTMLAAVSPEVREQLRADNVLNRFSRPDDVAAFIGHLVGIRSVSGQVFNLDSRILVT